MADIEQLKIQIVLDNGQVQAGFLDIERKAKSAGKKIEGSLDKSLSGLGEFAPDLANKISSVAPKITAALASPFVAAGLAVVAFGFAAKQALDFTLAGEKLLKIDKQFAAMAASANIAGDELKTKFIDSLDGLVDDSDAVASLNKAFVNLGDKVSQLPEVMLLARKATAQFGGEVTQNFEDINRAIASGSTRQLRAIGINIDADKAYTAYAKSLGIGKEALSEAGRQQAILNALTEIGATKFKNISPEIGGATTSLQRLNISLNNIKESFEVFVAKNYGDFFANLFESIDYGLKKITGNLTSSDKLKKLTDEIDSIQTKLNVLKLNKLSIQDQIGIEFKASLSILNSEINKTETALKGLNDQYSKLKSTSKIETPSSQPDQNAGSINTDELYKKIKANELELTKFQNSQVIERSKLDLVQLNNKEILSQQITDLQLRLQQDLQIKELEHQQKIIDIDIQFSALNGFTTEQRRTAEKALTDTFNADKISAEQTTQQKILDLQKAGSETSKEISSQSSQILKSGISNAIEAIGANLANGKGLFDDFGSNVAAIMGDLAISIGRTLLFTGPAIEAFIAAINTLVPGSGLVAAAAGLGLILFGSALKASVGKSGSQSASAAGGGIAASPSPTTELTPTENLTRQEAQTSVSVVIQGDVLDSDESGSRIVSLINDAFNKKGVIINQGVFA